MATTEDFRTFEHHGSIMSPEDTDGAPFPRQFGGRWALIHRPVPHSGGAKANMWLSFSPDLTNWGDHTVLLEGRTVHGVMAFSRYMGVWSHRSNLVRCSDPPLACKPWGTLEPLPQYWVF
jgi:predicted GH43/DUF377 family glycosyl hydrolase